MQRIALTLIVLSAGLGCLLVTGQETKPVPPKTVALNGHTFTLPPGFEIELVAGPPLVQRPIVADFDNQGRLYVAEANGAVTREDVAQKKPMHRILRLEDSKGVGKFDKVTVFADNMLFPEGTLWYNGSLYVAAPPSIWKLTDTDGDGVADQRSEWFQGKTLTGCANDLHGPYLGPDGWIYWCKGAFAQQTYELHGGKKFVTRAAHIFRSRPDGSGIEPVMTGGMDNPVDVVFTPGGERIFTTTFLVNPGGGQRDGLIHAIPGGINGKDQPVIYDATHKWTGPDLMPVLAHLGPAVPSGLVRFESNAFGQEYKDNLFTALFNLHKVTRHVLTPEGATFRARTEDFVVSSNLDFHPTDVQEDADGSLLIVDTGGWYKLCCPSSQLHKPDIPGAIYRVRRKAAPLIDDPRGRKIDWAGLPAVELEKLLEDHRPVVRRRAIQALGAKGTSAVGVLTRAICTSKTAEGRRNAVWAATRIDGAAARKAVHHALNDADETVRQVGIHSASLWRDQSAVLALRQLLHSSSLHNQRAAAEALGRIGDISASEDILKASAKRPVGDRVLEHALTYALIELADDRIRDGLKSAHATVRRDVLVALDQLGGKVDARTVAAEMTATDARLRETAWWIAGRHPEWGDELAGFFRERLVEKLSPAQREELFLRLARFAQARAIQELLIERLRDAPIEDRRLVLKALATANLKETPPTWLTALSASLAEPELVRSVLGTLRVLRLSKSQIPDVTRELLRLGDDEKASADVRVMALEAVPGGLSEMTPARLKLLLAHLGADQPVTLRALAASVLARSKLSSADLIALTEAFKSVGPMELDRVLEAFGKSTDPRVAAALLTSLKNAAARGSLRVDAIRQQLAKYPAVVHKQAEELYAQLDADLAKQRTRLEQLLPTLKDGDVRRGQKVFHSQKTACAACHAIGYLGGKLGPDLTRIGGIRSERDLLEAIVFPSLSLVRSYEPVQITTDEGKTHNGLIKSETTEEILLVVSADQQVRINRKDIEQIQPGKVSIMPSGLDQQLTPQELADLVAFLRACK